MLYTPLNFEQWDHQNTNNVHKLMQTYTYTHTHSQQSTPTAHNRSQLINARCRQVATNSTPCSCWLGMDGVESQVQEGLPMALQSGPPYHPLSEVEVSPLDPSASQLQVENTRPMTGHWSTNTHIYIPSDWISTFKSTARAFTIRSSSLCLQETRVYIEDQNFSYELNYSTIL